MAVVLNSIRCAVVAFGNGQVDGALITLFNLYQASAAKKSQRCALHYCVPFVSMPKAFTIYIRDGVCVRFFSLQIQQPVIIEVVVFLTEYSASQMIRCQFYEFFNLKQLKLRCMRAYGCVLVLILRKKTVEFFNIIHCLRFLCVALDVISISS